MSGSDQGKEVIPKRSFGFCRWCEAESVRLSYLMCPNCFRFEEAIPSKTSVLLNRPEVKKRLAGIVTVKTIVPELRAFLLDPKTRFPPERGLQEHWQTIQEVAVENVSDSDIRRRVEELMERGVEETPPEEELERDIGLEIVLRFILHVAVIRGVLKIDDEDDGVCVICGNDTEGGGQTLCHTCKSELTRDMSDGDSPMVEEEAPRKQLGMNTRDITLGKRGR